MAVILKKNSLFSQIEKRLDRKLPLSKLDGYTPRMREVLRILEESIPMKNLKEAAKDAGISPEYFYHAFHRVMKIHKIGINFSEYLVWLRVKKAMEILCTTPSDREFEVAKKVATCTRNLRWIFRKFTGMTVTEFRDKISRGKIIL
jgi:transcriptional regulator GlxA family with amidase domain